jgi:hypothetical protein
MGAHPRYERWTPPEVLKLQSALDRWQVNAQLKFNAPGNERLVLDERCAWCDLVKTAWDFVTKEVKP